MRSGTLCHLSEWHILPLVTDVTLQGSPGISLRERKKLRTRHSIEIQALELFAREGFETTTVESIAAACDIAPRTFFRYFASKDELLSGDGDRRLARLVQTLGSRPGDESPFEALREAVLALTTFYEGDRDAMLLRYKVFERNPRLQAKNLETQHLWEEAVVAALIERAPDRSHVELRLTAGAGMAALRAAVHHWQADGGTVDLFALVQHAFSRLATGLDA